MRRIKTRMLVLIVAVFCLLAFTITVNAAEYLEKLRVSAVEVININLDREYSFLQEYSSSDESIFKMNGKTGKALKEGTVYLTLPQKKEKKFIINVSANYDYVTITGDLMIDKGETTTLNAVVSPVALDQSVTWASSDETVATIDQNGKVTALNYGITTITAISKNDDKCIGKTIVLVDADDLENYEDIIQTIYDEEQTEVIDASNFQSVLYALTEQASRSVVGVEKYTIRKSYFSSQLEMSDFGSGVVYRRDAILNDGTVIQNAGDASKIDNFATYRYYVITSRHVVLDAKELKIYLGDEDESLNAILIQYDDKIDLAVVTFDSISYLPEIKIGNSDNISRGEFIIAIGNGYGKDYFRTSTFGVISYEKRYVATDTDDDEVSDWDCEYIQHDATINSQTSGSTSMNSGGNGGALINLKGELIGINSTKISSTTVDNMSFAVPVNLVSEIVSMLEVGTRPERPILGVQIIDVRNYYENPDSFKARYPGINIPDGLEFGYYVMEITKGGVGDLAHCQVGDVIVGFNGIDTKYTYQLRAELGKFIIGSGETAELKVIRNGEEVTLNVTF